MSESATVKVSNRYQISLPSLARKRLDIQAGDRLLVDIQEGMIVLMPRPDDYVKRMAGLHSEVWQNTDSGAYLERERDAWQTSNES